ncbi:MAG TPA: hypothetical protein VF666_15325 [Pyrinomonadaceae bacterium]|jgi:hypothetical protein
MNQRLDFSVALFAHIRRALIVAAMLLVCCASTHIDAQQKKKNEKTNNGASLPSSSLSLPALTRTTTRHELRRFGYGSTLTLYGAPQGSITIEAWTRSEIDITADIEVRADTEDELTQLAAVNGFVIDDDINHLTLLTTGTHDRKYMKRVARDFPKKLLTMPWKIDYRIRVPASVDLEIYAGRGAFNLSGVEGALRLNGGESIAALAPTGGSLEATFERGTINLRLTGRSWRGRGAQIRLATGDINVELPANFNADIDAAVLRSGRIENTYAGLAPRERTTQTEREQHLRSGVGGPAFSFTVGDGTLRIHQENKP